MQGLREEFDADRHEDINTVSYLKTNENPHEMFCGICNRTLFVDDGTLERVTRSMEEGLDNPLVCDDCAAEYEELAHAAG